MPSPNAAARLVLGFAASLCATSILVGFGYGEQRARAINACEAIDPDAYQSGLFFNPAGYRSYYLRSKCFQEAAVLFRDPALCDQVKRRWSLMSSSWGYAPDRCRQLVTEGMATDRAALEAIKSAYVAAGMTLRDFRVERDGNGRDFDIIPTFAGAYAHGYTLRFEIVRDAPNPPALVHASGYFVDSNAQMRLYVRQSDIKSHLPEFALAHSYTVRATMTLDVGTGGAAGYWSPEFIERVFPIRDRTTAMTRVLAF